jgi:hypothetical protein
MAVIIIIISKYSSVLYHVCAESEAAKPVTQTVQGMYCELYYRPTRIMNTSVTGQFQKTA